VRIASGAPLIVVEDDADAILLITCAIASVSTNIVVERLKVTMPMERAPELAAAHLQTAQSILGDLRPCPTSHQKRLFSKGNTRKKCDAKTVLLRELGTFLEPGEAAVTLRLIAPLTIAMLAIGAGHALAQDRAAGAPADVQAKEPASPIVNGVPSERCMKRELGPLQWEVVERRMLTRTAGQRHVLPAEACALIESLAEAEVSVIRYVETHPAGCDSAERLKVGHERTLALQKTVCTIAQQIERPGPGEPTPSDIVGRLAGLPVGPMGDF
jgi:hypothetical protein